MPTDLPGDFRQVASFLYTLISQCWSQNNGTSLHPRCTLHPTACCRWPCFGRRVGL